MVPAPPDYSLILECFIRETCTIDVDLKNPLLDKSITYQISILGDYLTGKQSIAIPPNGRVGYKLQYAPCNILLPN